MFAGLSGILLVLGFPDINLSILSWVALVPLLVAIHDTGWKESLMLGLVTGIIYFGGIANWIMVLHPYSTWFWVTLGFVVLTLYLSTYVFVFTVSVNFITRFWLLKAENWQLKAGYSFLVAVMWTELEIVRGHLATGLPWANLCHTQWENTPLIQICSFIGMYGVTFLIAMINGTIASFLIDIRGWRPSLKAAVIPFALLIASFAYGWISLSRSPLMSNEKIKVAMVPGNIGQDEKMRSWGKDTEWIFDKYIRATQYAADTKPDIIVWPETAVPDFIFPQSPELDRLKLLIPKWNAYFLTGTPSYEGEYPDFRVYNSAFLLSRTGEVIDWYHKIHLVPLSEYFPMKRYLPKKLRDIVTGVSDFDSGSRYTIFHAPPARIGVAICFESIFPQISRRFVNEGANVLCIVTNDAWFVGTFAPQQHFSMAPFRAVENRISVFRCANYGVSCIIDPWGRISQKLEPASREGYIAGEVSLRPGGTFYTKTGDYFPWSCLAFALFLVVWTWWYERGNTETRRYRGGKGFKARDARHKAQR